MFAAQCLGEVKFSGERWTEEKLARVIRMWLEGWSASVVAAEIGVTRNAVIGKIIQLEIRRPIMLATARGLWLNSSASWPARGGPKPKKDCRRIALFYATTLLM